MYLENSLLKSISSMAGSFLLSGSYMVSSFADEAAFAACFCKFLLFVVFFIMDLSSWE